MTLVSHISAADDIVVFTGDTDSWTQRNQGTGADEYQVNPQTQSATDEVVFNGAVPGTNVLIWRKTDICAVSIVNSLQVLLFVLKI